MQHTISCLMAQLCKAHRNAINAMLSQAGLHVGQEMVLLRLWEKDGVTQKELAQELCVEAPTVTRMLQRMERCELIERRADANDGRVSRVYVTERSFALEPTVKEGWAGLEERLLVGMTAEEQVLLHRLLANMLDNLSN